MDEPTRKIKVRCSFVIEVDVPAKINTHFAIEDNGCPGTGLVGAALDKHIKTCRDGGYCWACALQGENTIIDDVRPDAVVGE